MQKRWIGLAGVVIVAALIFLYLDKSSASRISSATTADRSAPQVDSKSGQPLISGNTAPPTVNTSVAKPAVPTESLGAASIQSLAEADNMVRLLQTARDSSSVEVREFAVNAPSMLCLTLTIARNAGFSPLVEARRARLDSALKVLQPNESASFKTAGAMCREYSQEGHVRDYLANELATANAPGAFAKRQLGATFSTEEERLSEQVKAVDRVMQSENVPAAIYLLKSSLASKVKLRLRPTLPDWLREDDVVVALIGIELGVCRAGLSCGQGSIARASVCAKYGECSSPDVESAYRSLHLLYDLSFDYADRVATLVKGSIDTKSSATLIAGP